MILVFVYFTLPLRPVRLNCQCRPGSDKTHFEFRPRINTGQIWWAECESALRRGEKIVIYAFKLLELLPSINSTNGSVSGRKGKGGGGNGTV
jgi:hypothetical protein